MRKLTPSRKDWPTTSWNAVSMGPAIFAGSRFRRRAFVQVDSRRRRKLLLIRYGTIVHTKIGIPDPLTHAIIMLSQVPMKRTLPNTKGCSGSLAQEEEVTMSVVSPSLLTLC